MEHGAPSDGSVAQSVGQWRLRRGASLVAGGATFTVWAPRARRIAVHVATGDGAGDHTLEPVPGERGVYSVHVPVVVAGDRYGFRIDEGSPLPDPVSRSQPHGVHGLSEIVDPASFAWTDDGWPGVALADYVLYEVHVGTFTPDGTFDAIIPRLADLAALGVTALELMPVSSFPGRRNWGYDGVHNYAPQRSYGGPDALRRLVDAAHALGVAVVLDCVYNHVGPEGNYLGQYGPYFTDVYRTPWGSAVNYDGPGSDGVRRWAHDNALYWLSEFHLDGLRLDAIQGIYDFGAIAFLEELSDEVHALGRQLGRKVQLIAESDLNDPRVVNPPERGGFGVDAQWADDFHHTLHATITGERHGYYADFTGIATAADVYEEPFFYARRYAPHRDRTHGRSSAGVPRQRFVVCAQNHDQTGNRPLGERLATLVAADRQRAAAALLLLSPYVPLLFMGEEYGETSPFLYFIEHGDPDLVEAVRAGRAREFHDIGKHDPPSDPQAEDTFVRSRIEWARRESPEGARLLALYRDLLALRRDEPAMRPGASEGHVQGTAEWFTDLRVMPLQNDIYDGVRSRRAVLCAFNLTDRPLDLAVRAEAVGQWTLRLSTDAVAYGGRGMASEIIIAPESDDDVSVNDEPRRLLAPPLQIEPPRRTIHLGAWSASVYVRDFPGDEYGRGL